MLAKQCNKIGLCRLFGVACVILLQSNTLHAQSRELFPCNNVAQVRTTIGLAKKTIALRLSAQDSAKGEDHARSVCEGKLKGAYLQRQEVQDLVANLDGEAWQKCLDNGEGAIVAPNLASLLNSAPQQFQGCRRPIPTRGPHACPGGKPRIVSFEELTAVPLPPQFEACRLTLNVYPPMNSCVDDGKYTNNLELTGLQFIAIHTGDLIQVDCFATGVTVNRRYKGKFCYIATPDCLNDQ